MALSVCHHPSEPDRQGVECGIKHKPRECPSYNRSQYPTAYSAPRKAHGDDNVFTVTRYRQRQGTTLRCLYEKGARHINAFESY